MYLNILHVFCLTNGSRVKSIYLRYNHVSLKHYTKPSHEPTLTYWQLDLYEQIEWSFNQYTEIFFGENTVAFQTAVCKMSAILFSFKHVNKLLINYSLKQNPPLMIWRCCNESFPYQQFHYYNNVSLTHWGRVTHTCVGELRHHW